MRLWSAAAGLAVLMWVAYSPPAQAWTDAQVRRVDAEVRFSPRSKQARVTLSLQLVVNGGRLRILDLRGVEGGRLEPEWVKDVAIYNADGRRLGAKPELRAFAGGVSLVLPRYARLSRGQYAVKIRYVADQQPNLSQVDGMTHWSWRLPAWEQAVYGVTADLALPHGAEPVVHDPVTEWQVRFRGRRRLFASRAHLPRQTPWHIEARWPTSAPVSAVAGAKALGAMTRPAEGAAPWAVAVRFVWPVMLAGLVALRLRNRNTALKAARRRPQPWFSLTQPQRYGAILVLGVAFGALWAWGLYFALWLWCVWPLLMVEHLPRRPVLGAGGSWTPIECIPEHRGAGQRWFARLGLAAVPLFATAAGVGLWRIGALGLDTTLYGIAWGHMAFLAAWVAPSLSPIDQSGAAVTAVLRSWQKQLMDRGIDSTVCIRGTDSDPGAYALMAQLASVPGKPHAAWILRLPSSARETPGVAMLVQVDPTQLDVIRALTDRIGPARYRSKDRMQHTFLRTGDALPPATLLEALATRPGKPQPSGAVQTSIAPPTRRAVSTQGVMLSAAATLR